MTPILEENTNNALLKTSSYLKILQIEENKWYAYHSLFGNLHSLDFKYKEVLDFFQTPKSLAQQVHLPDSWEEIIKEFSDIYFLVPFDFDERDITQRYLDNRRSRISTGESISAVQLNVSEGCNLKCSYCFADRVDERATNINLNARNAKRTMSFETAKEAVDTISSLALSNNNTGLVLKFFGREPLLNWKVISKVLDYCDSKPFKEFTYHFTITTNGTLFTPEIIEKFKKHNVEIVVSLDGFKDSNSQRTTHSGNSSFGLVEIGMLLLKSYSYSFTVASVISDQNYDSLSFDFLNHLKDRGVKQWEVKLLMQNDFGQLYSADEFAQKLFDLYKYGNSIDIEVTGDWYDPFATLFYTSKKIKDKRINRIAPNTCSATDHQISIEPSGSIYGCRALDTKVGGLSDINETLSSEDYHNLLMRTYYNIPFCHGCKLEAFCQGVCLGHSESKYGTIYQPDDTYCDIYRAVFDRLLSHWKS